MLKNYRNVLPIVFIFIIAACGTEQCINGPITVLFVSFPASGDSIELNQYFKNGRFDSIIISKLFTRANENYNRSGDTLTISQLFLDAAYDYEILLAGQNKSYKISDITIQQKEVHLGFSTDKTECVNPIQSYRLNAQVIKTDSYVLYLHY